MEIRYYRNDNENAEGPLFACQVDDDTRDLVIPNCELCRGKRTLEFQVMPQILQNVKENEAIDFGTMIVYSCDANCTIEAGFAEEVVIVQHFTGDGMKFDLGN